MSIDQYSTTPSSNDLTNYFKTGMRPSAVKTAGWDVMADIAQLLNATPAGGGTANAQTLINPRSFASLTHGLICCFKPAAANTGDWTFAPDGLPAKHVYAEGTLCIGGEATANFPALLKYDTALGSGAGGWHLLNPLVGPAGILSGGLEATIFTANGNFTPKASATYLVVGIGGGGGGGGGGNGTASNGGGGGVGGSGGGHGFSMQTLMAGTAYAVVIGGGGSGGTSNNDGNDGNLSSFNGVMIGAAGKGGRKGNNSVSAAAVGFPGTNGGGNGGGQGSASAVSVSSGGAGAANSGAGGGGAGGGNGANNGGVGGAGGSGILLVIRA
jgi:hypothetical protein